MNLGIVIPQLSQYGAAEVSLLECVKRWQQRHQITIYTPKVKMRLLREYDVNTKAVRVVKLPRLSPSRGRFRFLEETIVEPRIWESKIGRHAFGRADPISILLAMEKRMGCLRSFFEDGGLSLGNDPSPDQ